MNNGINPVHGAPLAPAAAGGMDSPVHQPHVGPLAPPSITLERLQKKEAMRQKMAARREAEQAAGAPAFVNPNVKKALNFDDDQG